MFIASSCAFLRSFPPPYEFKEVLRQCYNLGYKSVALISLTGFITGVVFTKQSRPSLAEFGASSWLPSLIAIAIIRALAPLITALISAGKIGSNIGAELGSMNVTEQIDAMEVSGTKPFKFLVVSRVVATTLMVPALTMYNGLIGMLGAFLNVYNNEMTSFRTFIANAFAQNVPGMLLYGKQTADRLQVIIKNLASASKKLDEDMEAMQHNFLLKGYFKKEHKNTSPPK